MSPRVVLTAMIAVVGFGEVARGARGVRLLQWEGPATLVPNPGPGTENFQLVAEAVWERSTAGRFAVRTTLPDGRTDSRPIGEGEGARSARLTVLVPAGSVRNLMPSAVEVRVAVVDAASGEVVSNELIAGIEEFPSPSRPSAADDARPFGWGTPLRGRAGDRTRAGPDGFVFARVPAAKGRPASFIATTEATNSQVGRRVKGYDPAANRSDEFALEGPEQPALNLTPKRAQDYLRVLGKADRSGIVYRLPTRDEWLLAARSGRSSAFWWGDEPTFPEGANFLGPEPALTIDATAPSLPSGKATSYRANPWGIYHTFGNIAEWATDDSGGFVRLGGHFRTPPSSPLPEVSATGPDDRGPDAFVGVRPVFDLSSEAGVKRIKAALGDDSGLSGIVVRFDPDRMTAILTGEVAETAVRRLADRRLQSLWFLSAVENRTTTPKVDPNRLATLGAPVGPVERIAPLGRPFDEATLRVSWAETLPVDGSEWWVNVYWPGGRSAHLLLERSPGKSKTLKALVDSSRAPSGAAVSVGLSLGAAAPGPEDPRIVSNLVAVRRGNR